MTAKAIIVRARAFLILILLYARTAAGPFCMPAEPSACAEIIVPGPVQRLGLEPRRAALIAGHVAQLGQYVARIAGQQGPRVLAVQLQQVVVGSFVEGHAELFADVAEHGFVVVAAQFRRHGSCSRCGAGRSRRPAAAAPGSRKIRRSRRRGREICSLCAATGNRRGAPLARSSGSSAPRASSAGGPGRR